MSWLPSRDLDEGILETKKKASLRQRHKPRYTCNRASGGPGMQTFILDISGQKSSGTGVFLPQGAGSNFQSSRRPASSPVILPSQVVQTLNLNVHELGLQLSRRPDPRNNTTARGGELNSLNNNNKNGKDDESTELCVISLRKNSPEILLPKEWTY
ncbi:hypothetical protein DITRI_Ditri11bG0094300 [Diplodiscus trichospermus]